MLIIYIGCIITIFGIGAFIIYKLFKKIEEIDKELEAELRKLETMEEYENRIEESK